MATIKVFGKDSSSAMEEVSNKLGLDAYILSTKSLEEGIEIEASNDPKEIKRSLPSKKISFMHEIKKRLPGEQEKVKNIDYFKKENKVDEYQQLTEIKNSLNNLIEDVRGMFITDNLSLSNELGQTTAIKLFQSNFDRKIIKDFSPSFEGLSYIRGRSAFMRAISEKLHNSDFSILNKKVSFIFGPSGSGKTTLVAKMAAKFSQEGNPVTLVSLMSKNNQSNDKLTSFSRILNIPNLKTTKDDLIEKTQFISGNLIIDVCLNSIDFLEMSKDIFEQFDKDKINSILVIPAGANKKFISNHAKKYRDLDPIVSLTKLDECEISSEEISELVLSNLKICFLSGSNSVIDELVTSSKDIFMQYLVENC